MKKLFSIILVLTLGITSFSQLKSDDVYISFYSKMDDITAKNTTVSSTLNQGTGDITFEVKIDAFSFVNKTMQKHFNQEGVMNSAEFPIAKFEGKIVNHSDVDYTADGTYTVKVSGIMTIKGKAIDFTADGKIIVKNGKVSATSNFDLDRFKFGVTGKEKSVSQILAIKVKASYQ